MPLIRRYYRLLMIVLSGASFLFCISVQTRAQQASFPKSETVSLASSSRLDFSPLSDELLGTATLPAPIAPPTPANPASTPLIRAIPPERSSVEVNASSQTLENGLAVPYHVMQTEILSSAGTWGDFSRFLQLMPSVVWNSDTSNDVMVRGGSPSENLYVVDGIEVPNINHIAVEGTTGGFTSMIDTATIGSVDMKAGAYDARYSSRLSSLVDIHTRQGKQSERAGALDVGISGVGGFVQRPVGNKATLLMSAHRSVLNLATKDIGIGGVPIFTNGTARFEWWPSNKDHVNALSVDGADAIRITPDPCDSGASNLVQTQYGGARSTTGFVWQHIHGPSIVSTVTASYSAQSQDIGQQWLTATLGANCSSNPVQATPVYKERTHDGISALSYGLQLGKGSWLYSLGTTGRLVNIDYAVSQPLGVQSPLSTNPQWTDADNFSRQFTTGQSGTYAEAVGRLGARWAVIAGTRVETFALTAAHMFEPRVSLAFRVNAHQTLNGAYGRSSQLPPLINILSYAGNMILRPMQVEQYSLGADLWRTHNISVGIETYRKCYSNEPVSTDYPSLMLANMVDTLGQQFVWLPLKSTGHGQAEGVELLLRAQSGGRFRLLGSASYSRTRYAAADGVLRPGNFDFPLVANGQITARLFWKFEIAIRNTYATGRPYTPFNMSLSKQQSRGIYDLTQINALRGPAYNRVDADFNRDIRISKGLLNIHAGLENALNRVNFLGYAWMNNCHPSPSDTSSCSLNSWDTPGSPQTKVTQMPRFPSAGIRYNF